MPRPRPEHRRHPWQRQWRRFAQRLLRAADAPAERGHGGHRLIRQ